MPEQLVVLMYEKEEGLPATPAVDKLNGEQSHLV